ncbi:MAG TPA: cation-translocating P-type ATPase [Puia sp.]|nr:cation-translocating P-type ATPase [Puia sp.]
MDPVKLQISVELPPGLSSAEAESLRTRYGSNMLHKPRGRGIWTILWDVLKEPMFILLMVATLLYFILGEQGQGMLMLVAMALVAAISVFQELRSSHALKALRKLTEPLTTVLRDGSFRRLAVEDIVPGDIIRVEEGERAPADGLILRCHDLSVDESIVTGESIPVDKAVTTGQNILYQGSTVNAGMAYARVTATGNNTLLGRLGQSIASIQIPPTQLQAWISKFVRAMAVFGIGAFVLIWLINYLHSGDLAMSLLTGLTLAMSAIPEEVPVAFSSFMALGALRLTALGIVVRHPHIIENLGALSVLCLDKTGTLTENRMQVKNVYDAGTGQMEEYAEGSLWKSSRVLWFARLASEEEPFDVMEKAIIRAFESSVEHEKYPALRMVHEYPLSGQPPMMTHVYEGKTLPVVAAKGAPERILRVCGMPEEDRIRWRRQVYELAAEGYRVLGVCSAEGREFPAEQDEFDWHFEGLVSLYDAPKAGLDKYFDEWRNAGVRVKIISGDYAGTVINIAKRAGLDGELAALTGDEVMALSPVQLAEKVRNIDIYARMFPDAKTRVIDALKANGDIVAMSGDGVNDGPALRSAHVGIAMGKKGTEIARQAADLVLSDDNLEKITEAIRHGRAIRANLRKAIRYLVTIHIPIILTASMPLLLGWKYPTVFMPVHIIFLELIMGPTCSIYYEREPVGDDVMTASGKPLPGGLLQGSDLVITIIQGAVAACGLLGLYYFFMSHGYDLPYTRTLVFITLLIDNVLLTLTGGRRNPLTVPVLLSSVVFIGCIYFLPFAKDLFGLTTVTGGHVLLAAAVSLITIGWIKVYTLAGMTNMGI